MMDTVTRFDMDGFDVEEFICADGEYVYYVDYAKLKQERDELAAQVEVMREFVLKVSQQKPEKPDHWNSCGQCECNENEAEELLSITPSAALREIQAMADFDTAEALAVSGLDSDCKVEIWLRKRAAARRKGE